MRIFGDYKCIRDMLITYLQSCAIYWFARLLLAQRLLGKHLVRVPGIASSTTTCCAVLLALSHPLQYGTSEGYPG